MADRPGCGLSLGKYWTMTGMPGMEVAELTSQGSLDMRFSDANSGVPNKTRSSVTLAVRDLAAQGRTRFGPDASE